MSEEMTGSVAPEAGADAGSSGLDWRAALDSDLREDPSLADIKDLNGLAKSYVHAQRMVGSDKVAIPRDDSTPEEWSEFYNRLGRPENYELQKDAMPEGFDYDSNVEDQMLKVFHENGLTNKQANAIYASYMDLMKNQFEGVQQDIGMKRDEWHAQLQRDFGKAFDEQIDLAKRAAAEFGGNDFLQWLDESGQGDNPMMVKMFAKIGKLMAESDATPGSSQGFALTPDAARQEIARLQRDGNFMRQYSDSQVDGHREAIEKMQNLFSYAYPDVEG